MVLLTFFMRAALIVGALAAFSPPCQSVYDCVSRGFALDLSPIVVQDLDKDPFYNPDLTQLKVGEALTLEIPDPEILSKYQIPLGVTMYRMIYGSSDPNGHLVPASAFILIPYTDTQGTQEPLEVIAWAHGTSGIERLCAPSIQNGLYYDYEAPMSMALQGFAVIGPDYVGQGTKATFNYLHGPAHAADMWVVVGHSEGGLTAWATNEREAKPGMSTPGFMGAVSIAPALANLKIISGNINRTHGNLGDTFLYPSYTLSTIKRFNPQVNVDQYYTPLGLTRRTLTEFGCFNTALGAFNNLTYQDVFNTEAWLTAKFATDWQATTGVDGKRRVAQPMLVIAGQADASVPLPVIQDAFETQCQAYPGTQVYLSEYPGLDHDPVAYASQLEYFDWIRVLFAGNNPMKPEACKTRVIQKSIPPSSSKSDGGKRSYSIRGDNARDWI